MRALRILVALQLLVIAGAGAATVASFPVFALVDERAHFAYVGEVAEEGRLPFLGRARISREIEALDEGVYPGPPRVDPRTRGLAGFSYEAFQPPLYYVVATPVYLAAGEDLERTLRALRALGLAALLAAAGLLWMLARRVAGPERALGAYAVALTPLMWPGVVVRTVTVSNAALELVLAVAASIALWEAGARRSGRWLIGAGALVGLGLLTRSTFVLFVPWLLWVAARGGAWRPALAALVLPLVLCAPWVASNLDRYGAPTGSAIVREMQESTLNPTGKRYGIGELPDRARSLPNGVLAEEWWFEFLSTPKRRVRDLFTIACFLVPLGLALWRRRDAEWVLALPLAAGLVLMAAGTVAGNWDLFYPRYLYGALPAFGVFAGLVVPWRAAIPIAGALAALWAYLSTVTPFAP